MKRRTVIPTDDNRQVENWGIYNPDDPDPANLQRAIDFVLSYLEEHDRATAELDKSLVLKQFGMARDGWTESSKHDPAATTLKRDRYFQALL
jgi:hypothetical protein